VVTLTGPGGVGKSRLALRVAHRVGRSFRDGVWLVELAGVDRPDLAPYALAQAMRVDEQPQVAIDDTLVAYLRERRALLVLDNCEHLTGACRALVGRIVSSCGGVRVLCTSRQRLGVAGEAVMVLSGLRTPPDGPEVSAETLGGSEALRLLVERAVAVAPDFALSESNRQAAGEICRRLDGLPLAIELAAVRLASLTAEDLVLRLDDRFRLLGADVGSGARRGHTLRATVGWSYDLLGEEERALWRRASVFPGGFGLEAAEQVCAGGVLASDRVVEVVGRLVDKSILTMGHGGRRTRYQLLETLRLYGAERLAEAGEVAAVQRRHLQWCAELVSGGDPVWWAGARQEAVLAVLDTEWLNLRAALERCAEPGGDAEVGLGMAADMWMYWVIRGRYRIGRQRLETLLDRTREPNETRAMALWALGFLIQTTGEHARGLALFEEAARVSVAVGADRASGYALMGQGLVHLRLGDITLAAEQLSSSRQVLTAVGDPMGLGMSCYFAATAAVLGGRLNEAEELGSQTLAATEPCGDTMFTALGRALAGIVAWRLGQLESAEPLLKEAVQAQDRIGHRWGLVTSLEGLAWAAADQDRLERAALLLGASASLLEELGTPLVHYWQDYHDRCQAAARTGLGDTRYQDCWQNGHDLAHADWVAAALDRPALPTAAPAPVTGHDEHPLLSVRELEVATLAAKGLSNPAIASALFLSVPTVKTHVSHILEKLGLDSRVQIAGWVAAHQPTVPR
jgi:predicted ATPase/DNA-binding CsgD family transcriptional regulator